MLEKPDSKAEKKEKARLKLNSLRAFRRNVKALSDFDRCDNPKCNNDGVHSHHIIFKSQGGTDEVSNGIYLCAVCHYWAGEGVPRTAAEQYGMDIMTARKFMIWVLTIRCNQSPIDNERWGDKIVELKMKHKGE
jgi:hypothetical protein